MTFLSGITLFPGAVWDMSVLRCFTQFKSSDESSICKVGTKAVMAIYGDSAVQCIVCEAGYQFTMQWI